jgi:hypothetical protein
MQLSEDSNAPFIGTPSRMPEGDVLPNQKVEVFVNVTDVESGVKNVTLYYNLNNSQTWIARSMSHNSTSYNATILGQPEDTYVRFKIVAYDYAGNNVTKNGETLHCTYQVVSEFPSITIVSIFIVLVAATMLSLKKRVLKLGIRNKAKS